MKPTAFVYTHDTFLTPYAKTAHGVIRGTNRFDILAVIDFKNAGKDAGELLDGNKKNIPIFSSIDEARQILGLTPDWIVFGSAFVGGLPPEDWKQNLMAAVREGMSLVSGLHFYFSEDKAFVEAARAGSATILDIRKPKPVSELHFWTGEIYKCPIPRVAVLGTDCAQGKRTTAKFLTDLCRRNGMKAELIYSGQTGWMQGYKYGFILDSVLNDFVSGELEHAILECARESRPDIMFLEGQSALRNPSGPCGSEFLLSADPAAIILQHTPFRDIFEDWEHLDHPALKIPDVEDEIHLIREYGKEVMAVTLNGTGGTGEQFIKYQQALHEKIGKPVIRPLQEGMDTLLPIIRRLIQKNAVK